MSSHVRSVIRQAKDNLRTLTGAPYLGRGLIIGLDWTGDCGVLVYFLTGRSENSRNRVLSVDSEMRVFTEAADPAKMKDPELIIYDAMLQDGRFAAVSNGAQTKDALTGAVHGSNLEESLLNGKWRYEPDWPNHTPRITGVLRMTDGKVAGSLGILRASEFGSAPAPGCDCVSYRFSEFVPGFGYGITTYSIYQSEPLSPFRGEPWLLPLPGNARSIADAYWEALAGENRIAVAVKVIAPDGRVTELAIKNQYEKVQPPEPVRKTRAPGAMKKKAKKK